MNDKDEDIVKKFNELNKMFYEVLHDCRLLLENNSRLEREVDWYKKYTDALVEHKDMLCLPADLSNLREANEKLAQQNEELKKVIEKLWYEESVDVEEIKKYL